ncbi:30S ribosomal protein S18 [Lolliginicoccus suaedae]|uniref:30S ribosomal protein S18 n=1 Tax=Lolliginicoccus suaedae TaxID=2605429 RepID=UPI0011EC3EB3|nr:30S ribosomal protein S18 [Lolliginicoccus suaedae]
MSHASLRLTPQQSCVFCASAGARIDYKDTALLRTFVSDRGRIRARRVTGTCVHHQMDVAAAVKVSREMALLPYTSTAR